MYISPYDYWLFGRHWRSFLNKYLRNKSNLLSGNKQFLWPVTARSTRWEGWNQYERLHWETWKHTNREKLQLTSSSSNVLKVVDLGSASLSIAAVETFGYSNMVKIKTHLRYIRTSEQHFENSLYILLLGSMLFQKLNTLKE